MAHEDDIRHLTQQVQALQNRINALEQKLGDTINLQAGGNSLIISPRGITITSQSGISIISSIGMEITAGTAMDITAGALMSVTAGAAFNGTFGSNTSWSVGGNMTTNIGGTSATTIGKDAAVAIGRSASLAVKNVAKGSFSDALNVSVGKNGTITSGTEFALKCGASAIDGKKDGTIAIKAKDFSLDASGKINMKATSDVVIKGSKLLHN